MGGLAPIEIIPVIDLRGGLVVRARAGDRQAYRPIETPLCPGTADPVAIAGALLAALPARRLYVADLDAIEGRAGPALAVLRALKAAIGPAEVWVDAGLSTPEDLGPFRDGGLGRVVLGTESLTDKAVSELAGRDVVLSLDSREGVPLGPARLHEDPSLWPADVIVMTLARVGTGQGPDFQRILETRRRAGPGTRIHAAGGLRGPEDLDPLRRAGADGVLVASAIHDGRLNRAHLG